MERTNKWYLTSGAADDPSLGDLWRSTRPRGRVSLSIGADSLSFSPSVYCSVAHCNSPPFTACGYFLTRALARAAVNLRGKLRIPIKRRAHTDTTFLVGHGTFPKEMAYYEHSNGESVSSCLSKSPTVHVELCQKPTRYQMKLPPTKRAIIVCLPLQCSATISAEGEGSGCSGETWLHVW